MEALLSSLIKLDVPNTHCVHVSGCLTRLTFTSTKAVQLTRRFGTVLTMDCTYKTNRFKMPLLHIVSFACTGATFTSAIAFLSAKTIDDYEWALNTYKGFMGNYLSLAIVTDRELALMQVTEVAFPVAHKMLYRWHIYKNVMVKHRTSFTEEDWQTFMTLFLRGDASEHGGRAAGEAGADSNGVGGYPAACYAICAFLDAIQDLLCWRICWQSAAFQVIILITCGRRTFSVETTPAG